MIRHDHKSVEDEGIQRLHSVQTFDRFPRIARMIEDASPIQRIRRHEHGGIG